MNFECKDFDLSAFDKTLVIAEMGVNHNGDIRLAEEMVTTAFSQGADVIKFQAFISEKEISKFAKKTPYQIETTSDLGNQLEMCKALELSPDQLTHMHKFCLDLGAPFLCAAFDFDSVDFLVDDLKVKTVKIPSGEMTNLPFLEYIGTKGVGILLSTGASNLVEVGVAVEKLTKSNSNEIALFHCVSSYPAPFEQINLRAMNTLQQVFKVPVGYSDHTVGIYASIAAAAMNACMVEKHFTLDKNLPGPDHRASIEPHELRELVNGIEIVNQVKGSSTKKASDCELENLPLIRKSIVAKNNLPKGHILSKNDIEFKRPEGGISPAMIDQVIGLKTSHDLFEDEPITWESVKWS
jgi:N,N'-diacetyllegionaminate synthase